MNYKKWEQVFFTVSLVIIGCATYIQASISGYISSTDKSRFLAVVSKSFANLQEGDVSTVYYGAKSFKLLNEQVAKVHKLDSCAYLQANFKAEGAPEFVFYAVAAWSVLDCTGALHKETTVKSLHGLLEKDDFSLVDIRFVLETFKIIGEKARNPTKVAQTIQARLKEDDNLQNLGHSLHAAALLGSAGQFALQRVEDVVVQADEVDGHILQWEGGLTVTSLLLTGLLRLPGVKPFTSAQADKFATYFLSRRSVQNPRGIVALLEAAIDLSESSISPVSISILGSAQVTPDEPDLKIQISDLLGRPLKPVPSPVIAQSATRVADDVVVLSKQPLKPGAAPTEFVLPLRLDPGQYRVGITAASHSAALYARVLGRVSLKSLEIGLGDADSVPKLMRLEHPSKLAETLQADSSQHLIVHFSLSRAVHQAFLRLHIGKEEIVFVAEQDNNKIYKIDVNLATEPGKSGLYEVELIVGDAIMSNPFRWPLGSLELKVAAASTYQPPVTRGLRPEIVHRFRPAEKRPPHLVSMLFTGLSAAPLLLLLIIWVSLGINFGNFSFAAVPFHIGLASIFGLFALFWLKLDMFTTCGWLLAVGGFTFLAGHRLLSQIATEKKH